MSIIEYVGKRTTFKGKTLWEILGNLRDGGAGRIVVRSRLEELYPEPSFMKIVKIETLPDDKPRKVRVWVEKVFRGQRFPGIRVIESASYKADYRLLSKEEEKAYCDLSAYPPREKKILPSRIEFPPLLKEMLLKDYERQGKKAPEEMLLKLHYRAAINNSYKVDTEGKITEPIRNGLGTPTSPELYKGVI